MVSGCLRFGPDDCRDFLVKVAISLAASYIALVTRGSCTGSGDQIQAVSGLTRPPFFVARRFQTMKPVYFGLRRISLTDERDQCCRHRAGSGETGGG